MKRVAILLYANDDVATALTALKAEQTVEVELDTISYTTILAEDIDFAHKYALRDIAKGEDILKYGLPIGKALADIGVGEWVHIHNCRSEHFGYHRDKYGLNA